jgi:hypothetical protein
MDNLTTVEHPLDVSYQQKRRQVVKSLLKLSASELDEKLRYDMAQPYGKHAADASMSQKAVGDIMTAPYVPSNLKGILDSSAGTTGNVLIRQDLEPTLYALFVKTFPFFERIAKGQWPLQLYYRFVF